jgi:CRP/FNR family transcriptional regulator, anaerobic regulatory protein
MLSPRKKRSRELGMPVRCAECSAIHKCWRELPPLRPPDARVQRRPVLPRGEYLWRQGQDFCGLHLVASGSLRVSETAPDGSEVVIGFAFPGDMVGFDGISRGAHAGSVMALEETTVCRLVWDPAGESDDQVPLEKSLLRRIADMNRTSAARRPTRDADVALGKFLAHLRQRIGRQEGDRIIVRLPMTRAEIASHLGLAEETISRTFRQLELEQGLRVSGREISWPAT